MCASLSECGVQAMLTSPTLLASLVKDGTRNHDLNRPTLYQLLMLKKQWTLPQCNISSDPLSFLSNPLYVKVLFVFCRVMEIYFLQLHNAGARKMSCHILFVIDFAFSRNIKSWRIGPTEFVVLNGI